VEQRRSLYVVAVIAVTGGSGELGGRVARRLAERGVEQRLVTRDRSRAPDLSGAEVVVARDYADGEAMRSALEGVETLYLVSAGEHPDRVSLHVSAVDAAVAAGVERIVYVSFLAAAPDCTFTFARDHFHTEEHIRASGVAFTVVRSSMYMDYLPLLAADGAITGPAGSGRLAAAARDDVADAAVAVLLADGVHDGRSYDLTGPEALTMAEIAERLGVRYIEETLEEARASRAPSGAPDWEIEGWVTSYAAIATGEMDVVTDAVERLAEHRPMTLDEFLERYPVDSGARRS
jgi:NAD(P)H dehydrogenase (quinone)